MEPHIYKYRFNRSAYYGVVVYLALFGLLGWLLYHLYEGGYLSAWYTSFIVAIVALMALSIPRKIVVTEDRVEIRCLLDITEVRRDEIASVRRVEPRRMKWFIPIFGGYGFFGYYGHFFDLRRFDRVRLYASEWKNFVEITDIYEERLYVSCTDADRLVAELTPPGGNRPDEEEEEEEEEKEIEAEEAAAQTDPASDGK
ncbi:PH domain-containing protein [Alistipes sp.]|uniref:PH domain-containing protein n=1 Tax=Alistipes sp. TaxID=1872444 RepID=UPI0025C281BA|nr:PH domain-containing protein [Alistipes sp.]MCI7140829.1 PH domain-containing protein [Alistipes sp.]MDY5396083.1 PH domain-containing protein [Alistipes sp.]